MANDYSEPYWTKTKPAKTDKANQPNAHTVPRRFLLPLDLCDPADPPPVWIGITPPPRCQSRLRLLLLPPPPLLLLPPLRAPPPPRPPPPPLLITTANSRAFPSKTTTSGFETLKGRASWFVSTEEGRELTEVRLCWRWKMKRMYKTNHVLLKPIFFCFCVLISLSPLIYLYKPHERN